MILLNEMRILVLIISFLLVIAPLLAHAQTNEAGGYLQAIDKIESTLPICEEALKRVDVNKISVNYQYGKIIEGNKTRGLYYIKSLYESISILKLEFKISESIIFYDNLQTLLSQFKTLISLLSNDSTFLNSKSSDVGINWASALSESQAPLSSAMNEYYTSTVRIARLMDGIMKSCNQDLCQYLKKLISQQVSIK